MKKIIKKNGKENKSTTKLKATNLEKIRKNNIKKLENTNLELKNRIESILFSEKKYYYFQIGFNRCATQSLYNAFIDCGLKAVHHNFRTSRLCFREYIATIMLDNLQMKVLNRPILDGKLSSYDAFFDMSYIFGNHEFNFYNYFKNMEKQYPGSIFIFNTRNCVDWILSRIKLGKEAPKYAFYYKNIDDEKIKEWIDHYFEHSYLVKEYFNKPIIKKRSKLFIYPINEKSLKDFCIELGIPNTHKIKEEKVDFIKNKKLSENDKKFINDNILNYIQSKIDKYGDPSKINWWK